MDRVEEIEAAIENLTAAEYQRIATWFSEREQMAWDQQLDRDNANGKLDFLFNEAEAEDKAGSLRQWP